MLEYKVRDNNVVTLIVIKRIRFNFIYSRP